MNIDIHVHCALEQYAIRGGNPNNPKSHYQADDKEILAHMNHLGYDKAVLMSSGEKKGIGNLHNTNDVCKELVHRHPQRFSWMCNLDAEEPETVYQRLARYKAEGAVGVGEVMINEWMDSPFLTALYAAASELNLPVLCHMSTAPGIAYGVCDHSGLPLLEKVLQENPGLQFIGHSQVFWMEISGDCPQDDAGRSGFGRGPVTEGGRVVELMRRYQNLYADLSAFSGYCAITRDREFGVNFCREFQDRLLFGTDMINQYVEFPLSAFLEEQHMAGALSRDVLEKIYYKNACRLFHI